MTLADPPRGCRHAGSLVTAYWFNSLFRGLLATAAQRREDRILDEARATGGDPLRVAAMFRLTARPAIRYAKTVWSLGPDLMSHLQRPFDAGEAQGESGRDPDRRNRGDNPVLQEGNSL